MAVPVPVLRLHSDDQLVALFRAGSDDAFRAIHDRYRVRLLAYAAQMLGGSRADAEDALQDVFVRAHQALRSNRQPIMLRAWLYRIAHNRCVDQLRRPAPIPSEIMPGAQLALSRGARHDPPTEAERSEDLRRLVADVHSLPEQQRSALLMRELQGLSYEELGCALGISVAGVKSLLLRARGGVLDAAAARDTPCVEIRLELASAHDRGVRASGRARRHMRECDQCSSYRGQLRSVSRQVAALVPVGPLGHLGLLFGIGGGGAGAGAGAGGGIAASSSSALLGGAASVTATKVAAIVCACALVGGAGALQVTAPSSHRAHAHAAKAHAARRTAAYLPPPSPTVVAHTTGGTIAPTPAVSRPAAGAAIPTAPSTISGQSQLALSTGSADAVDPTGAAQSPTTAATGTDPTSAATTLSGIPAAGSSVPGAAATPGSTSPDGSVPTGGPPGAAGQTATGSSADPGQTAATATGSSADPGQSGSATQGSTASAAPSATGSPVASSASVASAASPNQTPAAVASTQPVDRYSYREADSIRTVDGARFTGGTYVTTGGSFSIHWQHKSHLSASHHAQLLAHYVVDLH
ncbi:MAG TPA: sigma-70 family RNA polymerase sigma factor [Solirubrobacteraceae bacterium]|nr:sigma-70 family RNA polymerase sigma factor [Solirubrobacteraceae bacterium]